MSEKYFELSFGATSLFLGLSMNTTHVTKHLRRDNRKCAPSEDLDQSARSHILIKFFTGGCFGEIRMHSFLMLAKKNLIRLRGFVG